MAVELLTRANPRLDIGLFSASTLCSAVFHSVFTGFTLRGAPPVLVWSIGSTGMATVAVLMDAETARSPKGN